MLKDDIKTRFDDLIERGTHWQPQPEHDYWTDFVVIPEVQAWLLSAVNLIGVLAPASSAIRAESGRLMRDPGLEHGVPFHVVQKMRGLLSSTRQEWELGFLGRIEYVIVAATFDDFLDHAAEYHKAGKKMEAAILASAVLEDTVKKIAAKHSVPSAGMSLDSLVDAMVKAEVFTPVKAKRLKADAGIRNRALHAEWEEFDIKDVGKLIVDTRELIENYLDTPS